MPARRPQRARPRRCPPAVPSAGLVRGGYPCGEHSAELLHEAGLKTAWMVHDTVTYGVLSGEFREVVPALAAGARAGDADAVTEGYLEMARSCVDGHAHLRQERRIGGLPGKVARTGGRMGPPPVRRMDG